MSVDGFAAVDQHLDKLGGAWDENDERFPASRR